MSAGPMASLALRLRLQLGLGPAHADRACSPPAPLTSQALAMAKPPPRRRMMLQGMVSSALFHVSRGFVSVLGAGQREKTLTLRGGHGSLQACLCGGTRGSPGSHDLAPASDFGAAGENPHHMAWHLFYSE